METVVDPETARGVVVLVAAVLVIVTVGIHYEMLRTLTRLRPTLTQRVRGGLPIIVLGLMVAHMIEIIVFGAVFWALDGIEGFGGLEGAYEGAPSDYMYFSSVVYSTLGFGDLVAVGPVRLLAGVEAVVGLLMIGWSTSFTFLQMQRHWGPED